MPATAELARPKTWAAVRAEVERTLARLRAFDPDEPRDDSGKWTEGGGDGDGGTSADKPAAEPALDPHVISVGGDEWNKATAKRLEREYQTAKPTLDKMASDAVGHAIGGGEVDEDDQPFVPEEWDQVSNDIQEQAFDAYKEQSLQGYVDNEKQNWYESGQALDEAKSIVVSDYNEHKETEWAADAINDFRGEFDGRIPYTDDQLMAAISMTYQDGSDGGGKFEVNFDDEKLQEPSNLPPPEQGTLPGIEPVKPEEQLTEEMRDGLSKAIEKAFDKTADSKSGDISPPDYLEDSAAEMMESDWNDGLSDKSKFEWTKNNTELLSDETPTEQGVVVALPKTYDPLNTTSGEDYKRTQALARQLSVERAADLIAKNVFKREVTPALVNAVKSMDGKLWSDWKGSSTSNGGKLLQVAIADELGGRLKAKTSTDIDRAKVIANADKQMANVGGYEGVKEYVRAKWETSQYLLDKAGVKSLDLYRGIDKRGLEPGQYESAMAHMKDMRARMVGIHQQLPTLQVQRNGALSTSVAHGVANGWGAFGGRVVLRASVPRTAVVSVPAYGINIHSEQEVVVAGTAWKGWDAWAGEAPKFTEVPLAA
jgi:hypothetical protein